MRKTSSFVALVSLTAGFAATTTFLACGGNDTPQPVSSGAGTGGASSSSGAGGSPASSTGTGVGPASSSSGMMGTGGGTTGAGGGAAACSACAAGEISNPKCMANACLQDMECAAWVQCVATTCLK